MRWGVIKKLVIQISPGQETTVKDLDFFSHGIEKSGRVLSRSRSDFPQRMPLAAMWE